MEENGGVTVLINIHAFHQGPRALLSMEAVWGGAPEILASFSECLQIH